jgi:hypothetical protein
VSETDRREGARSGTVFTKYQIDGDGANVIRESALVCRRMRLKPRVSRRRLGEWRIVC